MMELGENLKAARLKKKMTLKELSKRSKVSTSQLSQVERNVSVPTVMSLLRIAESLDTNMSNLLPQREDKIAGSSLSGDSTKSQTVGVVRKSERKKIVLPGGSWYEMLCPDLQHNIEFIYIYHPPGIKVENPYTHKGEECGLVLEGTYKGIVGDEEIILEAGDSIYYDSTIPHSWETIGDKEMKAIWAISPPSF
jgi:transcriptional regulator with XRE-family HTH domain